MDGTVSIDAFSFGTKAETLEYLYQKSGRLKALVLKPCYFTVGKWQNNRKDVLNDIESTMSGVLRVIVRSSAKNEDSAQASMAGRYESLICENCREAVELTVEKVIRSYENPKPDDQVLVQQAIEDVQCSGVVFSIDPNTGGAYYVINYDDSTGSASSVTSGTGRETKLFYWFSGQKEYPVDKRMSLICRAVTNMKKLLGREALDVEFLFTKGQLYILQARPLVLKTRKKDPVKQCDVLGRIAGKIYSGNCKRPFLYGSRTIYGVMPDWNPAEMIGIHPGNLAASLYREIITDEVWAYQRDNYGYKKLRSFPLMVDFCGFPYIDVRVSFNSFIPADLDEAIAEKLVNYYLDRLEETPQKHDKVEFDIVFSCYTFDLPERIQILGKYGFSRSETDTITESLLHLTKGIADYKKGLWRKDAEKLKILESRRKTIQDSGLNRVDRAFWLLEDCKRYGTLPFAGLARAGFIAVQLLKSMVHKGMITPEEHEAFMNDLQTVGYQIKMDYASIGREDFIRKYGFLRPGTYDICARRYDEAPDIYFTWDRRDEQIQRKRDSFRLSLSQMERIQNTLVRHGMGQDVLGLFSFIKGAIEGREWAKFIFTHNVSELLRLTGEWGGTYGFTREELSYADIRIIKEAYSKAADERMLISQSVMEGKKKYEEGGGIVLPPLITNENEVYSFHVPGSQPTYITSKRIVGELYKDISQKGNHPDGRIFLLESADPGYDWIFSHQIAGFITKYGGANSHMAIRAGELSIPAVIGAGSRIYDMLCDASVVEIDAPKKIIRVLR